MRKGRDGEGWGGGGMEGGGEVADMRGSEEQSGERFRSEEGY